MVGAACLIAAVEIGLLTVRPLFLESIPLSWSISVREAGREAVGADALIFGDSLAKDGLAPRFIDPILGMRSHNLASLAGPALLSATLLDHAIGRGGRPKVVVFDVKPSLLVGGPRFVTTLWPEVMTPGEAARLAFDVRSGHFALELLVAYVLPSYRERHEIRNAVAWALTGTPNKSNFDNPPAVRNWAVNRGANLATPRPDYHGAVSEFDHQRLLSHGFHVDRIHRASVHRFIARAERAGARPYLLLAPFVAEVQARRDATGAEAKYIAFVESLRREHRGLTVLDARRANYPSQVFIDPIHLSAPGAQTLSEDVAAAIRAQLDGNSPGGAWVALPSFRPRSLPDDVEHVELSRARLASPTR
jgi:hypothetical protein